MKSPIYVKNNPKIKNYHALTQVVGGNIVFLHKIEEGREEKSFGIQVAKLAGIPKEILGNARKLYEIDKVTQKQLAGEKVGPIVIEEEVPIRVSRYF